MRTSFFNMRHVEPYFEEVKRLLIIIEKIFNIKFFIPICHIFIILVVKAHLLKVRVVVPTILVQTPNFEIYIIFSIFIDHRTRVLMIIVL